MSRSVESAAVPFLRRVTPAPAAARASRLELHQPHFDRIRRGRLDPNHHRVDNAGARRAPIAHALPVVSRAPPLEHLAILLAPNRRADLSTSILTEF